MSGRIYWVRPIESPTGDEMPIRAVSFEKAVAEWYDTEVFYSDESPPKAGEKDVYTLRVTDVETGELHYFTITVSAVVMEVE